MKKIALLLLLSSLQLFVQPARAALIDQSAELSRIPSWLTDVSTCGHRPDDGGETYFRLLYGRFFRGNSLLYIQWMRQPHDGSQPETLYTLAIPEFDADDHGELIFAMPRCQETRQGIRLDIEAESGHDLQIHRFDLRVFHEPGRYRLR